MTVTLKDRYGLTVLDEALRTNRWKRQSNNSNDILRTIAKLACPKPKISDPIYPLKFVI